MKKLATLASLLAIACTANENNSSPTEAVSDTARAEVAPIAVEATATANPLDPAHAWLATHAIPLATVEAAHGFDDLAPLAQWIGDARIVGLGEGTHGTREHFQAKHRLFEFLVEKLGFSIFSIEANMPEAYALDAYVMGGDGDVNALIEGMYFWTWRTEEVRDMVEWMRAYNAAHKRDPNARAVHFTGFDMQTGKVGIDVVRQFMERHDPDWFAAGGGNTLARLAQYDPYSSGSARDFGCATATFPVEQARGKHVRLRGWIKTEELENGWAGLWWRVDGPSHWFDNMQDRGLTGTTDWEQRELELDVPEDAAAIYFGLVMPGTGKAWFDDLSIEVDGEPWTNEGFDLDFEGSQPRGIVAADPSGGRPSRLYTAMLDTSAAKSGTQSFSLERKPTDPQASSGAEMRNAATDLLTHMHDSRERYARDADAASIEWAIQNARVVRQWTELGLTDRGYEHRDTCMAENIAWIAEQNPGAKIVVWAHNAHVQNESPFMGSHLRERFGADYVNVAFCSSHGTYTAMGRTMQGLGTFPLAEPPPESFEALLEASGAPRWLVDLRQARADDPACAWLTEDRPFGGTIGALEMPEHYRPTPLRERYDLLLWIKDSSAARQLPSSGAK